MPHRRSGIELRIQRGAHCEHSLHHSINVRGLGFEAEGSRINLHL